MYLATGAEPNTEAGYQRLIISSRRPLGMVGSGRDWSTRWIAVVPSARRPVGAGSRNFTGWKSGSPAERAVASGSIGTARARPGAASANPAASPPVSRPRLVSE